MIGPIPHINDFDGVYVHASTAMLEVKAERNGLLVLDKLDSGDPAKERGVFRTQ